MVVLTSAPQQVAEEYLRRHGLAVPLVVDASEQMERSLNVVWYGRPYLYSRRWRFSWAPRVIGPDDPFRDKDFLAVLRQASR